MNVLLIPGHNRASLGWDLPVFGTLECLTGALACAKEPSPNLTSGEWCPSSPLPGSRPWGWRRQQNFFLEVLNNSDSFGRASPYLQHTGSLIIVTCKLLSCSIWTLLPCVCVLSHLSCVWLFVTPWTLARPVPLSIGTSQARIQEWVTTSFSRGSSQPRDRTPMSYVSCLGRRVLHH